MILAAPLFRLKDKKPPISDKMKPGTEYSVHILEKVNDGK